MECYSKDGDATKVVEVDPVYRSVQFNAEYMEVREDYIKLFYPCNESKEDWIYIINNKTYTSVLTNVFKDDFSHIIKSNKILLSFLNCYRTGWKQESCNVRGDINVYEINKHRKVTVYINENMCDGSTQIIVGYEDKKEQYGQSGPRASKRELIEQLNDVFDKYDINKEIEVVQKDFELLTLDL